VRKSLTVAVLAGTLAFPAAAWAANSDQQNASKECRSERGTTAATREAFTARYRTFGKCVSAKTREEAKERQAAKRSAQEACRGKKDKTCVAEATRAAKQAADDRDAQAIADRKTAAKQCSQERGTTAASREAFAKKYGTNANRRNAFGKCVSAVAKTLGDS
jgi:hypothetical protein